MFEIQVDSTIKGMMPTILTLILLVASGYPVGWALTKLIAIEEEMVATGSKRDWKLIRRRLLFVLLTTSVTVFLMVQIAGDSNVASDEIAIFGLAMMVAMGVPILLYRWKQMKNKHDGSQ